MKKFFATAIAAVMVLSLAACGGSAAPAQEAAPAAEAAQEAPASEEVKTVQDGKLIMATNAAFPPYEFVSDEDGETIVGIDAEIAGMVAEELGLELEIQDMEFSSILTAVQTGKVDIGLAGLTVTEERLQNVNFTSTYAKGVQSIIVPEGSDIKSADDLAGHMIGVQESTTGHIYCEDDFGAGNVTAYVNGAMAVQALLTGSVDCVVIDNNPAKALASMNEGLIVLDTTYVEEDYAGAVSKDNEALLKAINGILDEKIADGTVQKIIDKYISAE
ncbi:MAG: ABC transporter substrate-binding protein [Lachnospiraceae bacterium]|nr:ABC transporter substrate-binding protein [Lachnospiraceae bacterium]